MFLTDGVGLRHAAQVALVFQTAIPQNFTDQLNKALVDRKWIGRSKQSDAADQHPDQPTDVLPEDIDREQFLQMKLMVRIEVMRL